MGPPPCETLSFVRVGDQYFLVVYKEPIWVKFDQTLGFSTQIYPVDALKPSGTGYLHYITRWGIDGNFEALVEYPAGTFRGNSSNQTRQRLNRFQAPYLDPVTEKFMIIQGDNVAVDIVVPFPGLLGAMWFYGWKMQMIQVNAAQIQGKEYVLLEDFRQVGIAMPTSNVAVGQNMIGGA